jgi:hypothetical protein
MGMDEITVVYEFLKKLPGPSLLAVAPLAATYFVFMGIAKNLTIVEYLDRRRGHQFEKIDTYLGKTEHSGDVTKAAIAEIRDTLAFKNATGIIANSKLRLPLISLYERTSYAIGWAEIRASIAYLEVGPAGKVVVKNETMFDLIQLWANRVAVVASVGLGFFGIMGAIVMLLGVLVGTPGAGTVQSAGQFGAMLLTGAMFAIFSAREIRPILKARLIRRELSILDAPVQV